MPPMKAIPKKCFCYRFRCPNKSDSTRGLPRSARVSEEYGRKCQEEWPSSARNIGKYWIHHNRVREQFLANQAFYREVQCLCCNCLAMTADWGNAGVVQQWEELMTGDMGCGRIREVLKMPVMLDVKSEWPRSASPKN